MAGASRSQRGAPPTLDAEPEVVLAALGVVTKRTYDDLDVETAEGVVLRLSPTSEKSLTDARVHVDEISVPPALRRQGRATRALTGFCRLADQYGFIIEGGPIGFMKARSARSLSRGFSGSDSNDKSPAPYHLSLIHI